MITYLSPNGRPASGLLNYDLQADLTSPSLRLAFVSNGFPEADRFRDILADHFARHMPGVGIELLEKDAMLAYTGEQLAMLERCDAAALLWGH